MSERVSGAFAQQMNEKSFSLSFVENIESHFRKSARQPPPARTQWVVPPALTWDDGFSVAYCDLAEICYQFANFIRERHAMGPEMPRRLYPGVDMIAAERKEQINKHNFNHLTDDFYVNDQLATAADAYLLAADADPGEVYTPPANWPWNPNEFRPSKRVKNLMKAGALIAAEIDRLVRASESNGAEEKKP